MHPNLQLTDAERAFLRQWMWDDFHMDVPLNERPAKQMQAAKGVNAKFLIGLAESIGMSIADQITIMEGPRPEGDTIWPWSSNEKLRSRAKITYRKWTCIETTDHGMIASCTMQRTLEPSKASI